MAISYPISSTAYANPGKSAIELSKGDPAPADGVWMSSDDALLLVAEVDRLLSVEELVREALKESNRNLDKAVSVSEGSIKDMSAAFERLEECQTSRANGFDTMDILLAGGTGVAVGIIATALFLSLH